MWVCPCAAGECAWLCVACVWCADVPMCTSTCTVTLCRGHSAGALCLYVGGRVLGQLSIPRGPSAMENFCRETCLRALLCSESITMCTYVCAVDVYLCSYVCVLVHGFVCCGHVSMYTDTRAVYQCALWEYVCVHSLSMCFCAILISA